MRNLDWRLRANASARPRHDIVISDDTQFGCWSNSKCVDVALILPASRADAFEMNDSVGGWCWIGWNWWYELSWPGGVCDDSFVGCVVFINPLEERNENERKDFFSSVFIRIFFDYVSDWATLVESLRSVSWHVWSRGSVLIASHENCRLKRSMWKRKKENLQMSRRKSARESENSSSGISWFNQNASVSAGGERKLKVDEHFSERSVSRCDFLFRAEKKSQKKFSRICFSFIFTGDDLNRSLKQPIMRRRRVIEKSGGSRGCGCVWKSAGLTRK